MRKSTNESQQICMPRPMANLSCWGQTANNWPLLGMFSFIDSEKICVQLGQVLLVPPWRSCGMPGSGASWPVALVGWWERQSQLLPSVAGRKRAASVTEGAAPHFERVAFTLLSDFCLVLVQLLQLVQLVHCSLCSRQLYEASQAAPQPKLAQSPAG